MGEQSHLPGVHTGLPKPGDDRVDWIVAGGHLGMGDRAGPVVEDADVGEGPADVHPDPIEKGRLVSWPGADGSVLANHRSRSGAAVSSREPR